MKHILVLLLIMAPTYASATSDLLCAGDVYSAYIVVGADDEDYTKDDIAEASLYVKGKVAPIPFENHEFMARELAWVNSEDDFSVNSLGIELKDKTTNEVVKISASGENAILEYKSKSYELTCNWER